MDTENQEVSLGYKKPSWEVLYHIWCSNCDYDKTVRGRAFTCPQCGKNLLEKRYLF